MIASKKQKIILMYASPALVTKFFKIASAHDPYSWIFLGKNVSLCIQIENLLGGDSHRIEIGDELQLTAIACRQEFIDYIGKISQDTNKISWWWTSLSEKNPFISNAFLHFCYLKLSLTIQRRRGENLVFICESRGVLECLHIALTKKTLCEIVHLDSSAQKSSETIVSFFRSVVQKGYFLIRWSVKIALAAVYHLLVRKHYYLQDQKDIIYIHTWADRRSFRNPEKFEDIFLGSLGSALKQKGQNVIYLVSVLPNINFLIVLKNLYQQTIRCSVIEEYLTLLDPVLALIRVHFNYPRNLEVPLFLQMDVSSIIKEELKKDFLSSRAAQTYLYYFVGKRISRHGNISELIYSYENLMWEKMLCISIRKYSPKTKIVGHANSTISPMELFYFISRDEKKVIPIPDLIVVNGTRDREILTSSGFDPDMVVIGGALRYSAINRCNIRMKNLEDTVQQILIVTPDDLDASLELVIKCIEAFGEVKRFYVKIKIHPTLPIRHVKPYFPRLPKNFSLHDEPIGELLSSADLVVYTSSTVSVEAIAQGIPILHIRSDMTIDHDVYNERDAIPAASKPRDIFVTACELMDKKECILENSSQIVEEIFSPVTDQSITLFMP